MKRMFAKTTSGANVWRLFLACLLLTSMSVSPANGGSENGATSRTWKEVAELSAAELARVDLTTDTSRHPEYSYLPAEPYPFTSPYTPEEMGYRAMEFTQRPRWSCAFANLFGSISSQGFLLVNGQAVGYVDYPSTAGVGAEMAKKPGEVLYRYLTQHLHPPESFGSMNLVTRYRTDQQFVKKQDRFRYSLSLRRVRRQNSLRRGDRYPRMAMTFDDAAGRAAWEFSWKLLGTDILYKTVRFPITRPRVMVTQVDGSFHEVATKDFKLMGDDYPFYTADGGVECYVVEARPKKDWLPDYYASRILYWFDKHAFYPLRTETYGPDGTLVQVEVRLTKLANPDLGERGYGPFIHIYWDVKADLLSYNIRDGIRPMRWSKVDELTFFHPDFMRRQWRLVPVRSYMGVDRPEEFFLRPGLEPGKFPKERPIELSPELMVRLQAQDAAGRLVFEVPAAATPSVQQVTQKQ